jgi:hypothetical protein
MIALAAGSLVSTFASAAVVVDLTPSTSWVTGNVSLTGVTAGSIQSGQFGGTDPGTAGTIGVLDDDARVVANSGSHDIGVTSGKFYAAGFIRHNDYNNGGSAIRPSMASQVANNVNLVAGVAGFDAIRLAAGNGPQFRPDSDTTISGTTTVLTSGIVQGLLLWKQADFLTGNAAVDLGAGSALSAQVRDRDGRVELLSNVHFVVEIGGALYASDPTAIDASLNDPATISLTTSPTTQWRPVTLDPVISGTNPNYITLGAPGAMSLEHVTSVGVLYDSNIAFNTAPSQNTSYAWGLDLFSFTVDAQPIPEPATLALLAGAGLLALRRRA